MTMAASRIGLLDLGDLAPRTRPVSIERFGEQEILRGMLNGPRCPGKVRVALFAASEPLRGLTEDMPQAELEQVAYECLRDSLLAVIDGLDFHEAEVLAGNEKLAHLILHELGWEREDDDEDSPPVLALPLTGGAYCQSCQQPITSDPTCS